jgi:hypothetical protein
MPAQAGIQALQARLSANFLDSRFRGNDALSLYSVKNLPLKGREGELHHPRAHIRRKPDNLGMARRLGNHLLAQTGGDLGVNLGVLAILVAQVIRHVLNAQAGF